jgi:hypothetical protein
MVVGLLPRVRKLSVHGKEAVRDFAASLVEGPEGQPLLKNLVQLFNAPSLWVKYRVPTASKRVRLGLWAQRIHVSMIWLFI